MASEEMEIRTGSVLVPTCTIALALVSVAEPGTVSCFCEVNHIGNKTGACRRGAASPHNGITSIQIPSAPIAKPMVWPKRRGDNPSNIRSPTMVPMRTPTVATMMGVQSVSRSCPRVPEVDRCSRRIDQETGCRCSSDESKRWKAKCHQRGRAQTALIAGDAAKEARHEAEQRDNRPLRLPARRPTRELRDGGQEQETTEDTRESAWAESSVDQGARQRTRCAEQAEPHNDRAIHVGAQTPAADGRRRRVRQRHECDGRRGAESDGEQWRHQAANPESDDSGRGAGDDRDDEHRDEKHGAILDQRAGSNSSIGFPSGSSI